MASRGIHLASVVIFLWAAATTAQLHPATPPSQAVCAAIASTDRVDCSNGVSNLTASQCASRACCFTDNFCYFPTAGKPIETLHMIHSNHFDAGYADLTAGVINMYFDTYFPRAASVGAAFRKATGMPLKWMTFSYIVSLYIDCPSGMDLHCPDEDALKVFKSAVTARDIVWPAFPTNAELAVGDDSILSFGVFMSNKTSDDLNVPRSQVMSDRDVPGLPRSAIPILKKAGVKLFTEGMNGRMVPVNVPPIFMWQDPQSSEEMLTLWHWAGYGQLGDPGNPVRVPSSSHAIVYNWRGDNAGPPMSLEEAMSDIVKCKAYYPGARVVTSTFDEFVEGVLEDGVDKILPKISQDLADTWTWGLASDPLKLMRSRAMIRSRAACEAANVAECSPSNAQYYNFSRMIHKNLEHTWGVSVFHFGKEHDADWDNKAFHQQIAANESNFALMMSSWEEQRNWGIDFALDALRGTNGSPDHPVLSIIEKEFADMVPTVIDPKAEGFVEIASTGPISLGSFSKILIDADGSISSLVDSSENQLAGSNNRLGLVRYQTLVEQDFLDWQNEYIRPGKGGGDEYGKPNSFMNAVPTPEHQLASASLSKLWRKGSTLLVDMEFNKSLHQFYGAPESVRINITADTDSITFEVMTQNKTSTRLPEALYVSFNPAGSGTSNWLMDKLGTMVNVLDIADGAAKGLHAISTGVVSQGNASTRPWTMKINSKDVALARWDEPLPFPTPIHRQPDLSLGVHFLCNDNIWNTNYPFWYPFNENDSNTKFRFSIAMEYP